MMRLAMIVCGVLAGSQAGLANEPSLAQRCARIRNDDTIRPYEPSLRAGLLKAYARLFPQSKIPPNQQLVAGSHIRCMDGRLLACFTGANLPCGKMSTSRASKGADAFCHSNPQVQVVPAFAVGHDSAYAYRCVAGRADVVGETFELDPRGFAAKLWAPIE